MSDKAQVRITYEKVRIEARLGDGLPQISDGFGGWEEVERASDLSLTRWAGQAPLRMDLPLFLDGYSDNRSIQRKLDRILKLGRSKDGDEAPPVFRVSGPIPFSGKHWVMESTPDFGDGHRAKDGRLVRQHLTLHLLEYVKPDRIKIKRRRSHGYTTKKNDTLLSIARHLRPELNGGDSIELARTIAILNDLRDIRKKLDAGIHLRLP